MDRDALFARWVQRQAMHCGFRAIRVDGSQSIAATADRVAELLRLESQTTGAKLT